MTAQIFGKYPVEQPAGADDVLARLASSAVGNGGDLVACVQRGVGAVPRTTTERANESISILDYGGNGGAGNDNVQALMRACAAGGAGVRLRFPRHGINNYVLGGALPAATTEGVTLDVEPGVTLTVLDIGYLHKTARFVRDTRLWLSALQCEFWVGPGWPHVPASSTGQVSYADRDLGEMVYVDVAKLAPRRVAYNTDVFSDFVPTSAAGGAVVLTTTGADKYDALLTRMAPGSELSVSFEDAVNAAPLVMVRTAVSYYGLSVSLGDVAQPVLFAKNSGTPPAAAGIEYMGMGEHASYAGYKSVWTIRINTTTEFSVLYNDYEVKRVQTNDEIVQAGFGAQGDAGGTIALRRWSAKRGGKSTGHAAVGIAIFTDSTGDGTLMGAWPDVMVDLLDGANGQRVTYLKNYGVSGESSGAQAARCTPEALAGVDVVIIAVGANDEQGGVPVAQYIANVDYIGSMAESMGKRVIIAPPSLFYSQGQAGAGVGQNTQNYDGGRAYRAAIMELCASPENNYKLMNVNGALGPVMANFKNQAISNIALLGRDPVVFDNIHPTMRARRQIARLAAECVMGMLSPEPTMRREFKPLPVSSAQGGWTSGAGEEVAGTERNHVGKLALGGLLMRGASVADNTIMRTMPENMRPVRPVRRSVACDGGMANVLIEPGTGNMRLFACPPGAQWISLDGIEYSTM